MNEPSVFVCESKTMDLDVVHRNNGTPIRHEEWHNMYGLAMSKATYEGMQRSLKGERPFVLTRAGYAGIQRYSAVWTGDNRSYWDHMAMFMPMSMNLGLSGIAFCGSDIGGFEHSTSGELLARWTQMGIFSPFCRNHSAYKTLYQEPWRFGTEVEDICRKYISLRYGMLPYIYSYFHEASQTGLPLIRSLVMEYPDDRNTYTLSDQFMFGEEILIAPVYRPGTEYRVVYLPEGGWYDFWTGKRYDGGQHIMVHAPLDTLPIFIRSGAILPETDKSQHTTDAGWLSLTMNFYSEGLKEQDKSYHEFQLYEDDGITDSYKNESYNKLKFYMEENDSSIHLGYKAIHTGYDNKRENMNMVIKNMDRAPRSISGLQQAETLEELNKEAAGWYYDTISAEVKMIVPQTNEWACVVEK
ncbi:Alpha-xylosidase [compost metagenome]